MQIEHPRHLVTYLLCEKNTDCCGAQSEWHRTLIDFKIPQTSNGSKGPPPLNGLGLVSFSVAVGFVLAHAADDRNVLLNFFINLSNNLISAFKVLTWFSPFGMLSLIASKIVRAYRVSDR